MGPEQVWGVGSGPGLGVEGGCLGREREDTRLVRKAGGRGTEKKTDVSRLRRERAVRHSCEPAQGGWTALL